MRASYFLLKRKKNIQISYYVCPKCHTSWPDLYPKCHTSPSDLYTNHADADQNLNENLMILLATAGCNYIMGMPLGDDIMLNYQTTAFHDTATVRQLLNLRPSPEFERWLESMGIMANGRLTKRAGDPSLFF